MILPIQLPRGNHEIQPLEICADFGSTCGRDPRKGAATLIWICYRGWGVLVDLFASCIGLGRLSLGPLKINFAIQIWSASWKICVDLKLGFQLAVFRLDGVCLTSSPLLICPAVNSPGLFQPLLICGR